MTRRAAPTAVLACAGFAACATAPSLYTVDSHTPVAPFPGDGAGGDTAGDAAGDARRGAATTLRQDGPYVVEVWFVRDDGDCLAAIPVTVGPCEAGDAHVLRPVSYVRDVDVAGPPGRAAPRSVRATACQGVHVEYQVAAGSALDADTVAVAFCVASARIDEPVAERSIRIAPPPAERVVIALPRAETIEYVGARRVRLGAVVDLATLPSYDGEKTVRIRISRGGSPTPRESTGSAPADILGEPWPDVALSSLLHAALRGDPERRTSIEERTARATQYLCGAVSGPHDGAALAAEPAFGVPCLEFTSVVAAGFAMAHRVETSYVRGFKLRDGFADPDVAVHTSGIGVAGGRLHWNPASEFIPRTRQVAPGLVVTSDELLLDTPHARVRDLPIGGDVVVPLGRDVSGAAAVARVVSGPAGGAITPVR